MRERKGEKKGRGVYVDLGLSSYGVSRSLSVSEYSAFSEFDNGVNIGCIVFCSIK